MLACAAAGHAASFPPEYRFRSLRTSRVTIHFHQGLEPMAREAAAMADEIITRHERRYGYRIGRVQMVLADDQDDPNGFATPLPYPMVNLRAAAPDGSDDFGNLEGWLRELLTHELAHTVHLDQARGIVKLGRSVFGRAPFLFPNGVTPQWMIEGLATYEETEGTSFGRGRSADARMLRRMAAIEGVYPGEDRFTTGLDRWPLGQGPYVFGEAFLRYLSVRFGEGTLPAIARVNAGWPLPFFDELTAHRVTGKGFHPRWGEFVRAEKERFAAEAEGVKARGVTASRALTTRGIRQFGARVSPDGRTVAFTSSSLTRRRAIHLLARGDGRERRLTERNGGSGLSWTPDGGSLVFDDVDVYRLHWTRYDLRAVDVESGRTRWLTRGQRARDPDVSPDGTRVVFVRRYADRSELAVVGIDGSSVRDLTASDNGVQWSGPTWHPGGESLVASRWRPGGWCDLVRVDPATGAVTELTSDRAREVEPAWTPDGAHLVFRSDRDGISNLYARRESDGAIRRVTNVLGGAFAPSVASDGTLLFSGYSARGYDIHQTSVDWAALPEAEPFVDTFPEGHPPVTPASGETTPYRPWSTLLPRSWLPYFVNGDTLRVGAATAGTDPLFRHAWGLEAYRNVDLERFGGSVFYRYDRFRPELLVVAQQGYEDEETLLRSRELMVRVTLPLTRTRRSAQQVSLAWRRSRDEAAANDVITVPLVLNLGGLELSWVGTHDVQQHPYSVSPSHGERLRVAVMREDRIFGSDLPMVKASADARAYRRVFGESDVLAVRLGAGTTFGRPTFVRSFAVGGFPDGGLFDLSRTNHVILRGYPNKAFTGRRFLGGTVEYRVPLAHPQRGLWSLPFFLRHLHGTVFADAAHAWSGELRTADIKTSAGAALGVDLYLAHGLPFTATAGVAHGFGDRGDTRHYVRMGLSF